MNQLDCRGPRPAAAVHIGRQPIYDSQGDLHGYELLFRASATAASSHRSGTCVVSETAEDAATTATILAAFSAFDLKGLLGGRPGFVNLTRAFILGTLPLPFTPDAAVIEILETVEVDDSVVVGARALASAGYSLALDDFVYRPGTEELLEAASIVKVDVLATPWEEVLATASRARAHGALLLAEKVEDEVMMRRCVDEGFRMFQGYYLGRPQTLTAQTLTPGHASLLHLLAQLSDPDTTATRLEESVRRDPCLAFRLLTIANSAASGRQRRVHSLRDAVVLVGLTRLRSWVVLLALSGCAQRSALVPGALVQAFACELLARRTPGAAADEAFTLGLLDGVGRALGLAPERLPALMPVLAPELAAALVGTPSPLRGVLDTIQAYERGDASSVLAQRGELEEVSQAYLQALSLTARLEAEVTSES